MWTNIQSTEVRKGGFRMFSATCSYCNTQHLRPKHNLESTYGCKPCALARSAHGMVGTRVYNTWIGMKDRCNNPNHHSYPNYGGRGITVCEAWEAFQVFYADMGDPPVGTEIDRIDNNAGYSPDNCRWITRSENSRNRRTARLITAHGKTKSITAWEEELGLARQTIYSRLARGESPEQALRVGVVSKFCNKRYS
jgi:hypothetical protein